MVTNDNSDIATDDDDDDGDDDDDNDDDLVATETVSDVLVRSDRLKAAILSDIDRRSDSLGLGTSPRTLHTEIIAEDTI